MGKTSDKTVYKTTGHCGFGSGSNTAVELQIVSAI